MRIWVSLWWRFVFRWDSGGLVLGGICEYMCQHAPISGDMSYHNLKYLQINWVGGKKGRCFNGQGAEKGSCSGGQSVVRLRFCGEKIGTVKVRRASSRSLV